jgi:hypothetical protein
MKIACLMVLASALSCFGANNPIYAADRVVISYSSRSYAFLRELQKELLWQ